MQLEELYSNLSLGVLSNLAIGDEGSGFIPYSDQKKVALAINKGLLALYGRFILSEKEVQIRAYDGKTLYPLKKIYADQDATVVAQKFITDTVDAPFIEDVLRIFDVYDNKGTKLELNDPIGTGPVYTPNPTTLQIVEPVTGNTYFAMYQARHPKVIAEDLAQEIELPDVLMTALEAYVAHCIMSPMNGQEHTMKAAEHYAAYDMFCEDVLAKDLISTSLNSDTEKLYDRGFV